MRGIPVAEDSAAVHLTPQPAVGIALYLDEAVAHEVAAVHPDIAFDRYFAAVHILADAFYRPKRLAAEDYLNVFGTLRIACDLEIKEIGQKDLAVALPDSE